MFFSVIRCGTRDAVSVCVEFDGKLGGITMKQTITVDGEDRVVREDTAKAFRGVHWALLSILAFILIVLALFIGGVIKMGSNGGVDRSPAQIEREAGR